MYLVFKYSCKIYLVFKYISIVYLVFKYICKMFLLFKYILVRAGQQLITKVIKYVKCIFNYIGAYNAA